MRRSARARSGSSARQSGKRGSRFGPRTWERWCLREEVHVFIILLLYVSGIFCPSCELIRSRGDRRRRTDPPSARSRLVRRFRWRCFHHCCVHDLAKVWFGKPKMESGLLALGGVSDSWWLLARQQGQGLMAGGMTTPSPQQAASACVFECSSGLAIVPVELFHCAAFPLSCP